MLHILYFWKPTILCMTSTNSTQPSTCNLQSNLVYVPYIHKYYNLYVSGTFRNQVFKKGFLLFNLIEYHIIHFMIYIIYKRKFRHLLNIYFFICKSKYKVSINYFHFTFPTKRFKVIYS